MSTFRLCLRVAVLVLTLMGLPLSAWAIVCGGLTVTHTMTCGVGANYNNGTAQVIEGTSCGDSLTLDTHDTFCGRAGIDIIVVRGSAGGTAVIYGGDENDYITCYENCWADGGNDDDYFVCTYIDGQPTCEFLGNDDDDDFSCYSECDVTGGSGSDNAQIFLDFFTASSTFVTVHLDAGTDYLYIDGVYDYGEVDLIAGGSTGTDYLTCWDGDWATININPVNIQSFETIANCE